jgi:hypothetical protein
MINKQRTNEINNQSHCRSFSPFLLSFLSYMYPPFSHTLSLLASKSISSHLTSSRENHVFSVLLHIAIGLNSHLSQSAFEKLVETQDDYSVVLRYSIADWSKGYSNRLRYATKPDTRDFQLIYHHLART